MAFKALSRIRKDRFSRSLEQDSEHHDVRDTIPEQAHDRETRRAQESLKELNNSLLILASIFPNVQIEVFREMLLSFDQESRLHVVTEALLKHKSEWVKGRWKTLDKDQNIINPKCSAGSVSGSGVQLSEQFRSKPYRHAVRTVLKSEFSSLSKSSIDAVLAENNFSYSLSRPTLMALTSKSWRYAFASFFFRRKAQDNNPTTHPLLDFTDSSEPTILPTGSLELDGELYDTILAPMLQTRRDEIIRHDFSLAMELNESQAEEVGDLHDCECCYSSVPFEQIAACTGDGHFVCFRCIRQTVNEALFGQGWNQSADLRRDTLKCVAVSAGNCNGVLPCKLIQRALGEESNGAEVYKQFKNRFSTACISKIEQPLIKCPFCSYAEVDDVYILPHQRRWNFRPISDIPLISLLVFIIFSIVVLPLIPLYLFKDRTLLTSWISNTTDRIIRKRRTHIFRCQSPSCGRTSCIICSKPWYDPHICYESERLRYDSHISNALSAALKRTCPKCSVSFVKSSGCNKLTCICGYKMCYVCRAELGAGDTGYSHFCEHFRPTGGSCQCNKCDLYREEDEQLVLRRARREAEESWKRTEGNPAPDPGTTNKVGRDEWRDWFDKTVEGLIKFPS